MSAVAALGNLGSKAWRRLLAARKPFVRLARRQARAGEQRTIVEKALATEREIARVVSHGGPVVAGPWLAEVGYEALYWVPFLRWVQDRFALTPDRCVVMSRGGVEHWYRDIAGAYVDIFDCLTPDVLAARNDARQRSHEGGGRKQSSRTSLDDELILAAGRRLGLGDVPVLHPSMLFGLFRDVWQGNLPQDFLWQRTDHRLVARPERPRFTGLPERYVAVKFYTGTALPDTVEHREALRWLVQALAEETPVVVLEFGEAVDDHSDYAFSGMTNVISARGWMDARHNLGVQTALIAHAAGFVSTCGGLAWLAPFMGVPTVAVYADDRLLAPHLLVERQAGRRVGAADFRLLDLAALRQVWPHLKGAGLTAPR